jgi:hypothetical protein
MNSKLKNKLLEEVKRRGLVVEQQTKNSDYVEMISLLLHSRNQIHVLHLQTKSYAEHKALDDYYSGIVDLIDGLVESYQGKYEILKGYKSYDIEEYKGTESTIKYLKDLCDKVMKLKKCCEDSYIQNQIDEVCELINSTLYKLRFLN